MNNKWKIWAFLCILLLSGCMHSWETGNEDIKDYSKELVIGKTTKADIRRSLGKPDKTEVSGRGFEYWAYYYTAASRTGVSYIPLAVLFARDRMIESETHELVLQFKPNGVLTNYKAGIYQ